MIPAKRLATRPCSSCILSALPTGAYEMLHLIHRPNGNVVICTNSFLIVYRYQKSGWRTATSVDEVLLEHLEWRGAGL
jgi:hypothetical protein